jgi:DNA-directed RNA polymerase subunit H (RpoH/RPB5)
MEKYIPYEVYSNCWRLLEYRGIKAANGVTQMTQEEFSKKFNLSGYAVILASPARGDRPQVIIQVAPGTDYVSKGPALEKLILSFQPAVNDILTVVPDTISTHARKRFIDLRKQYPMSYLEVYEYEMFEIEKPKNCMSVKHTIANELEVTEYCTKFRTDRTKFQYILDTDPAAVWIGLRPGQTALIERASDNVGVINVYRYCVAESKKKK